MKYSGIGGQAVMEGVMMKNGDRYAVAVRRPDGEITVEASEYTGVAKNKKIKKLPILRGVFNFIESLTLGFRTLTFSASFFEEEEGDKEPSQSRRSPAENSKKEDFWMGITIAVSVLMAIGIFMLLPYGISLLFGRVISSEWMKALLEGVLRLLIFVGYVAGISLMPDVKRVYMYHGAEHKCINCIENGMDLTVENVRSSSRLHKRCGTSFLLIVMLVSILFFFFIRVESPVFRLLLRLLLIPVIAGVSYEFIRLAGRNDSALVNLLSRPGLLLQKITTREPEDAMIEVGIASVEAVFDWRAYLKECRAGGRGSGPTLSFGGKCTYREALLSGQSFLEGKGISDAAVDAWLLLAMAWGQDKNYYYLHMNDTADEAVCCEYKALLEKRAGHIPLQHITGEQEFMGLRFLVNPSVLIPRQDTEILVEEAGKRVRSGMRVLDLCTGSGCIIISLLKNMPQMHGTASDISAQALLTAEKNAGLHGVSVEFVKSDLFENIQGEFDMIVSNPPYIPTEDIRNLMPEVQEYEPHNALDGGADGLAFYRNILSEANGYMKPDGWLLFETGHDQSGTVSALMQQAGYREIETVKDLAGINRVVIGRKSCLTD